MKSNDVIMKSGNFRLACVFVVQQSWFHKRRLHNLKPPKQLGHENQVVILWKYSRLMMINDTISNNSVLLA